MLHLTQSDNFYWNCLLNIVKNKTFCTVKIYSKVVCVSKHISSNVFQILKEDNISILVSTNS